MKKVLTLALTGALTLGVAGVAQADINNSTFDLNKLTIKSNDSGTAKKPKPVTLSLGVLGGTKDGTGQPSTSTNLRITLPRGIKWNGGAWARGKRCAVSPRSKSECPRGSKIGFGHVDAQGGPLSESITVTAYVLKNASLGLWLEGTPLPLNVMLQGRVRQGVINVAIPFPVQQPVPNVFSAIRNLNFTLNGRTKVKGKTRGAVESVGCFNRKWTMKFDNIVTDGKLTDTRRASCRK